ncbi:hypothetical protein WDV06_29735 [Streptomyces racemochromogenes]|uniref:Lipoprotein n=1 Tax=Streptomyces racemochromogenes TaxID=67353 RepID=A0ABW7PNH0_9ACTN
MTVASGRTTARVPGARRALAVALAVTGLLAVVGCGAPGPREDDAVSAARAFEDALAAARYGQACALLAPQTRQQVADGQECAGALAKERLPAAPGAGPEPPAEVYGRQAWVRLGGDTLFLSQFDEGWKIIAAGCTPRTDLPYDCKVKKG